MKTTSLAIDHRTTVFVLMVLIAIAGIYAYAVLPRESAPDVQIPYVIVSTRHQGVSPGDIVNTITSEIEDRITGISDVKEIRSTSSEGTSTIVVEFQSGVDLDDALQKVRDKVDEARPELPPEADDPDVNEINISEFPIMLINIHGPAGLLAMKEVAENLQDDIERIPGVLEARITGDLTRQIRIEVDPWRMAALRVPIGELIRAVTAENQTVSSGAMDMDQVRLGTRVPGEFTNPAEINSLIIMQNGTLPVRLSDFATVRDTFEDRLSKSRFNGQESITLSVIKRAGSNIIDIADEAFRIVDEYRTRSPEGIELDITLDSSSDIRMMVGDLENNMLTGLLLVVLVLMFFMGIRNSVLVATAIPFSMLMTFTVLYLLGVTLNMVVLFSLILVLGMLVDNAIVIVENIYRHMEQGKGRIEASKEATAEVGWAVITSTLTTVAAFAPLLFWPGIVGEFMGYLPLTLIIALFASLFVAMIINPTLCSVFVKIKPPKPGEQPHLDERGVPHGWFIRQYELLLAFCIRPWIRGLLILAGFILLIGSIFLWSTVSGKVEFFPAGDPPRAQINLTLPVGTPLETTSAFSEAIEELVRRHQVGKPGGHGNISYITANIGSAGSGIESFMGGGGGENTHVAQISIEFIDYETRPVSSLETVDRLRRDIGNPPGLDVSVDVEENGPPTGEPVQIEISGDDFDTVRAIADQVRRTVAGVPGVTDVEDDYDPGMPEMNFLVDQELAGRVGLRSSEIATVIRGAIQGIEVSTYREGNEEFDIVVRLPEIFRQTIDQIQSLTVARQDGQSVPLSAIAETRFGHGLSAIKRIDRKPTITVTGQLEPGKTSQEVLQEARTLLDTLRRPPGYTIRYTGESEDMEDAMSFLMQAGVVGIFLILLILVTQFDSLILPLIILISVLLSWIGVFGGLAIHQMAFGVLMTGMGIISLAGIVVNNSIVLIDYTEKLRQRGMQRREAVLAAGATRLRPVLLTATTTILGLLPMAMGINLDLRNLAFNTRSESSLWWAPMAIAVIYGLTVSTLLTLFAVPATYSIFSGIRERYDAFKIRRREKREKHGSES